MSEITFAQAKEFLDNITSKDKVVIIHDDDLDGMTSGILTYDFCLKKQSKVVHLSFSRGKNSLKDFNLKNFNKIIIVDLGPSLIIGDIKSIKDKEILYIDHHPKRGEQFGNNILEYKTIGEIPTSRTIYELIGGKEWLAIMGTFSDAGDKFKENKKFLKDFINALEISETEFKEEYVWKFGSLLIYFENDLDKAFDILKDMTDWKEILNLREYWEIIDEEVSTALNNYSENSERLEHINFYYFKPKFGIKSIVINKISFANPKEIFIIAVPKGDNKIGVSARNQSGEFDVSELLRAGIIDLENATAGGHPAASAGIILAKDLEKFKENIRNFVKSNSIK